jgi:hypothetical protein
MLDSAVQRILARAIPTSKEVMLLVSLFRKSALMIKGTGINGLTGRHN